MKDLGVAFLVAAGTGLFLVVFFNLQSSDLTLACAGVFVLGFFIGSMYPRIWWMGVVGGWFGSLTASGWGQTVWVALFPAAGLVGGLAGWVFRARRGGGTDITPAPPSDR